MITLRKIVIAFILTALMLNTAVMSIQAFASPGKGNGTNKTYIKEKTHLIYKDGNLKQTSNNEENDDEEFEKDTSWFDYKDPKSTYKITTEEQLFGLASLVNENQVDKWKPTRLENFQGVTFILTRDIDLTHKWTPVGLGNTSYFAGVFDGNGHAINNVRINAESSNIGFFGCFSGEVRNLTLSGKIDSMSDNCGGFAGNLTSGARVINCVSNISVSGNSKIGGIVGYNNGGTIEDCTNNGDIYGSIKVGGVVGENWGGNVSRCANMGKINSSKRGVATYGTGGIAGRSLSSNATVSECYNRGNILSDTEATGGVVGYANASNSIISDCYNSGEIMIKQSKNMDTASKSWAGGVVGIVGSEDVVVQNCYNLGKIINADINGGVVGRYITAFNAKESGCKNNYYLYDNVKKGIGEYNYSDKDTIKRENKGIDENSLKGLATALGISFIKDISGYYGNNGFPVLRWQKPVPKEEASYIQGVSMDVQKKLDSYLIGIVDDEDVGSIILDLYNLKDIMTDFILQFNSAKESMKKNDDMYTIIDNKFKDAKGSGR